MLTKTLALAVGLVLVAGGSYARLQETLEIKPYMPASDSLKARFSGVKTYFQRLAERMPEADYDFRPTPVMESFATRIAHTAGMNFEKCAYLVARPNPYQGVDLDATYTKKAELLTLLRESFTFCDGYMLRLSPAVLAETTQIKAPPGASFAEVKVELGGVAIDVVSHNMEMYGYLAVYLRLKGIVPPTSGK